MILETILAATRQEVAKRKAAKPVAEWLPLIGKMPATKGFKAALSQPGRVNLIAEYKRASPSKGVIRTDLTPEEVVTAYAGNGAAAISVLTEPFFFQGRPDFLRLARQTTRIPLLRKDFIIDEYQLYEARVLGADAVLLIVAALSRQQLKNYLDLAHELDLMCLVEVHTREETEAAVESGAAIIGINNRNLANFETSLETTFRLAPYVPDDRVLVSESGIFTKQDIEVLSQCGVQAVLVGEALMRSPSPWRKLRELAGDRDGPD
ncbi:indole-3-glycerol phosphate synthase signature [Lucifera butyrica]|uniref:Indole-3-glycerol phosphate synthase n=1 Tax=Lucifera butyrica TaxID=1351585 RepID=A0A498R6Y9_9FIRM|nr:indole-3-glycerol phosphate synthase TrpC [Lucifera butyrica]VBB06657.1 indole-3-glycerol phosphate synthase signature [Lucifera butyrica]